MAATERLQAKSATVHELTSNGVNQDLSSKVNAIFMNAWFN